MLELQGNFDIFSLPQGSHEAICVTTNGILKMNGHAVMGKGIAKQANDRFCLSEQLGKYLTMYGNRLFFMGNHYFNGTNQFSIITFPTKYDWREDSDINLIIKSAEQLVKTCEKFGITKCYLPPVGCGNGNLNWEHTVKPWLSQILDDRFIVVLR